MPDCFEWLDSYGVGVRAFDESHNKCIGITNSSVSASMENKPLDQITDLLFDQVLQFTRDTLHGRTLKGEVAPFLVDWLITHILAEDLRHKTHFGKLGIR